MPLTDFQAKVAAALAPNRSEDSHLAGGAAIHRDAGSLRYSNDLDYFHDTPERVATAFAQDRRVLESGGFELAVGLELDGFVRAVVGRDGERTKVEWAHDADWRFFPAVPDPLAGFVLHPVDLAVNKLLALVGRDEPRDFIDILYLDRTLMPLAAMVWAAPGKDPGFSPQLILDLLKRRGRLRETDVARLRLREPVDLIQTKTRWLQMLASAEAFVRSLPTSEVGCLYLRDGAVVAPERATAVHRGQPGGRALS